MPTRPFFSDTSRLRKEAKNNLESGTLQLKRWWVDKYNLPPTHDLFIGQSIAELTLEMYEDLFSQRETLRENIHQVTKYQDEQDILEKINNINEILGEPNDVVDEVIDKWERELLEGKIPNLDE